MRKRAKGFVALLFAAPLLRRIGYHFSVVTRNVDKTFFLRLFLSLFGIVLVAALLVTVIEGPARRRRSSSAAPTASTGASRR